MLGLMPEVVQKAEMPSFVSDKARLDTSNFTNSCNVASTSQRMSNYST